MNRQAIIFEAPVYTIEAALKAFAGGVDRLELCADFGEGGTTPSLGVFRTIKKNIEIPVFVMIRPRGGDYIYSDLELEAMKEDIKFFMDHGADGFVFGILDESGRVNEAACRELLSLAKDKPCTFHRAFDLTRDMEEALDTLISLGFQRVLTSGGENSVGEGIQKIIRLLELAHNKIIIIPGGGTQTRHLLELNQNHQLCEIHASCKKVSASARNFNKHLKPAYLPDLEGRFLTVDEDLVREFKSLLSSL
ncbi:MAG: copper homeostasis protein CutC [Cyclobacteriaceae bacterium]